jgi:hypothetical protein
MQSKLEGLNPKNGEINKDLPLAPDAIAGLRDHKRQYTKELMAEARNQRKPELDPNRAYPNWRDSTTLNLSMCPPLTESRITHWSAAGVRPPLDIKCGPLLRYVWTDYDSRDDPLALYTMLLVTNDGESVYAPSPVLEIAGINTDQDVAATQLTPEILHQERGVTFWRWKIYLHLIADERRLSYRINRSLENLGFWVPGANQPMRFVFYSCNGTLSPLNILIISGFSQSVNPDDFSGPDPMWKDVLRKHKQTPWHVMLGGGDQIYCDGLPKKSKLFKAWLQISNLHHKFCTPYTEELKAEIEEFYLEHYCEVHFSSTMLTDRYPVVSPGAVWPW